MTTRRIDPGRQFRVRVESRDDLELVSTLLQDAIVPVREIVYDPAHRRFAMMAQRFRWELEEAGPVGEDDPVSERVHCAVLINEVDAARTRGFDITERGRILELLSCNLADDGLYLCFAGGTTIGLSIRRLSCLAEDVGDSWPTWSRPTHPDDADECD
ncbi:MAG: DUF2948 family protein [Alphaproteobacteria bacterium]|nr:DUF2948 family protein [Alphaproteobacteria bacterium]